MVGGFFGRGVCVGGVVGGGGGGGGGVVLGGQYFREVRD